MGISPIVGPYSLPTIHPSQPPLSSSEFEEGFLEFLQQETTQQRLQSSEALYLSEVRDELDWSVLEEAWPIFDPLETLHPQEIGDEPDLSAFPISQGATSIPISSSSLAISTLQPSTAHLPFSMGISPIVGPYSLPTIHPSQPPLSSSEFEEGFLEFLQQETTQQRLQSSEALYLSEVRDELDWSVLEEAWLVPDKEFFAVTPQWSQVFEDESSNAAIGDQQTQKQAAAKTPPVKSRIHPLSQKNLDAQTTHHLDGRRPKMQLGTVEDRSCSFCGITGTLQWYKDPQDKTKDRCYACYRKIKTCLDSLVGKFCFSCGTTETSQWYKDPQDKSKDRCNACYQKARAQLDSLAGKSCSFCGTTETSRWYKDPQDKAKNRCNACYQKARAQLDSLVGKFCFSCGTTETSQWYKDSQDKSKDRCIACYQKAKMHRDSLASKPCSSCGTTETSQWYKDPQDKAKNRCNACYQKAKMHRDSLVGKFCFSCGTTETSRWCKDQQDRSRDHCLACYRKAQKSLDKDRKRLAEEELEQRSAPALPPMLQYSPLHPSCPR